MSVTDDVTEYGRLLVVVGRGGSGGGGGGGGAGRMRLVTARDAEPNTSRDKDNGRQERG
jgi:hypothetical protein